MKKLVLGLGWALIGRACAPCARRAAPAFLLLLAGTCLANHVLESPNGNVAANVFEDAGHLSIKVARNGETVLLPSPIGMVLDGVDLGENANIVSTESYSVDETYPWNGNHSTAVNRCNGAKINLKSKGVEWQLDLRAYDDGVAFRFSSAKEQVLFNGESTVLKFDPSLTAKAMRHSMGEESRVYSLPITEIMNDKNGRTLPPLLLYPDDQSQYIMVLEGSGFDFHGYSLLAQGGAAFKVDYAEKPDGWEIEGGVETPWKIIGVFDSLNDMVNTDIVPNVCPAPDPLLFPEGMNESWIKPGKSTWNWWAKLSWKFEQQLELVDLAEKIGADYHLVDIGWDQKWKTEDKSSYEFLRELCDYASAQGVGIWVWKTSDVSLNLELSKDSSKNKFGPLQEVHVSLDVDEMRAEVKRIADAGAKGIKLDYIQSENAKWKTYMENFLKVCAEHKLMVDFHGCPTPAGEARTYPNEVTREAIYGGEKLRGGGGAKKMPTAQYIDLLFTRGIAGHADYTPTIFSHPQGEGFTHAMQLASAMMFTSPLLCWADHPDQYLASEGLEIIKTLPTVWDESIVLPGSKLDELAVFARRKGTDWYVAGINGFADRKQEYALQLDFLGGGKYAAFICQDEVSVETHSIKVVSSVVGENDVINMAMLPSGGFIIRLTEK
jgi:alpha-glucosidase